MIVKSRQSLCRPGLSPPIYQHGPRCREKKIESSRRFENGKGLKRHPHSMHADDRGGVALQTNSRPKNADEMHDVDLREDVA